VFIPDKADDRLQGLIRNVVVHEALVAECPKERVL